MLEPGNPPDWALRGGIRMRSDRGEPRGSGVDGETRGT